MRAPQPHRRFKARKQAREIPYRLTTRESTSKELHSALRDSFIPLDNRRKDPSKGTQRRVAETLKKNKSGIPKPLLGIAVWNQVPVYDRSAGQPQPTLDPSLAKLLKTVLSLDTAAALSLRSNPLFDVFPPYPDQVILDSRYVPPRPRGNKRQARLEICVPTFKNQRPTLDTLRQLADPRTWSQVRFFWSGIKARDPRYIVKEPKAKRSIEARLNLPLQEGAKSESIQLKILEFTDRPLRTQIRFSAGKNNLLKLYRGQITVQKEPGRPGAVRIINQKAVQFAKPNALADETLKYWLYAETACLVMQS